MVLSAKLLVKFKHNIQDVPINKTVFEEL